MSKLSQSDLMLCYDGSLEGFFCAVFDAYALHCIPAGIAPATFAQPALGQSVRDVVTELSHAERVRVGLATHGGRRAYERVKTAFLSDDEGREEVLFSYIVKVMDEGPRAVGDLACPCVARVESLARAVMAERENVLQFLRFEEVEGGVFCARVSPRCCVIPLLTRHFVERFSTQPFLIYDDVHHMALACKDGKAGLALCDEVPVPQRTRNEREYQHLWKVFYDSVTNEQRYNPDLRRSLMPMRFWKNMPEMQLALSQC